GLLEVRARGGALDGAQILEVLGKLERQVDRLVTILDGYVAHLGHGLPVESDGSPGALALALVRARPLAEERGVRLRADIAGLDDSEALAVGEGDLGRTLDTVLGFALDATPRGGAVAVAARREGDEVLITVHHGGGAMSVDDLHVFERGAVGA